MPGPGRGAWAPATRSCDNPGKYLRALLRSAQVQPGAMGGRAVQRRFHRSCQIFRRQVEGLVTGKDVVWALSVSGQSPNVLCALDAAKSKRATIIGFTSRRGNPLAERCELCLMVDAETSDRVQEAHELAYHLICDRVECAFA